MMEPDWFKKWFANRGQALQVGVQLAAFVVAAIVAAPTLAANHIFSTGSVLYFLVAFGVIVTAARILPALAAQKSQDAVPTPLSTDYAFEEISLHVGDFHEVTRRVTMNMKFTVMRINLGEKLSVDIKVKALSIYHGPQVEALADNTYRMPIAEHGMEPGSLFTFSFDNDYMQFFALSVRHINPHANLVNLSCCEATIRSSCPSPISKDTRN